MAKSRSREPEPPKGPPKLCVQRAVAKQQLEGDLANGQALKTREGDYQENKAEFEAWSELVRERLRRIFTTEEYSGNFDFAGAGTVSLFGGRERHFEEELRDKLRELKSLIQRLDIIDEEESVRAPAYSSRAAALVDEPKSQQVFIVHGRNSEVKETVARFLDRLQVSYCILHERPDDGKTIIEKLLDHAQQAGFAIVIVTPDDIGALAGGTPSGRARQNVIFELGLFIGLLGRNKVRIVKRGDVEIPSDLHGVLYTDLDPNEGWRMTLARELKNAGIEFDPAKLVS